MRESFMGVNEGAIHTILASALNVYMFKDRADAGQQLAGKLMTYANRQDVVVIGLPRGGVVTAAEVAKALKAPLDIIVPRKIGYPGNPELAIGALAEEGITVMNPYASDVPQETIAQIVEKEKQEARRRLTVYRGERKPLDLRNKVAILVDDGIATGATMRAAIVSAKAKGALKIVVAAPVIATDTMIVLEEEADELIVLEVPAFFDAVGRFYENFSQTTDDEVIRVLNPR